ncbi:HMG box protein [Stagonosporopsis vannaccii]|nr:HMG box protein [Stagonosporopsis vannaccii]
MLARGALCRLAAEVPKQATHDLPKLASLVQATRASYALPLRTLSHVSQPQIRSYATKEPTTTVKKAVKAKAATGKSVKKTAAAKKPAAKKKKAAPKKAKKKAAPKKAARKPKKVLTDEEKEKKTINNLRKLALREPFVRKPLSAYTVFIQEAAKVTERSGPKSDLTDLTKGWKDITPAEHEKYNHLAAQRTEERLAEYKAWVESHTPDQIRIANNARYSLRRKLEGKLKSGVYPRHTQRIVDERAVKRPMNSWALFFSERQSSSDFKNMAVADRTKLIAGEWRALSVNEKQRFEDQAAADRQRYAREVAAQTSA